MPTEMLTLETQEAVFFSRLRSEAAEDAEMHLAWTADERWREKDPFRGVDPTAPCMFQFKVGENIAFLWRNRQGEVKWEVLQGENLWERRVADHWLCFLKQGFNRTENEPFTQWVRTLDFLVEGLEAMDLATAARIVLEYDDLLPVPGALILTLWGSLELANERFQEVDRIPVPATGLCRQIDQAGARRQFVYWRDVLGGRRLDLWEGRPPGRLLFTAEFGSLEEMRAYGWPAIVGREQAMPPPER
jgi:hypothetical protein